MYLKLQYPKSYCFSGILLFGEMHLFETTEEVNHTFLQAEQ